MKQNILSILMFFVSLSIQAQTKQIEILHTNDTHSCVLPQKTTMPDTLIAGRGGFLRRINMIDEERQKHPNLLLLDSGDFSQGSAFYTIYKGEVEVLLMNMMKYDAATIGNHEFDYGLENMARIFKMAEFPIICSNYDFKNTPVEGLTKKYVIIKRNGIKIGLFALSPKLEGLVEAKNCAGVKYSDPIKTANEMAELLKNKKKCDVVICLSHLGWDEPDMNDTIMLKETKSIDLVLGGHSHTYMEKLYYSKNSQGRDVPVDQNGKHGVFVGKIILDFTKK